MCCKFQDGHVCIYTCWSLSSAYCLLVYFSVCKTLTNQHHLYVCSSKFIFLSVTLCFCWLTSNNNLGLFCIVWGCMHDYLFFALLFLILGKTKGEWFCRKRDDALISGNPLYLPVLSFMFCCELFYLFCWAHLAMGAEMVSAVETKIVPRIGLLWAIQHRSSKWK